MLSLKSTVSPAANALVETIHPRSPLVVHPDDFAPWLDCSSDDVRDVVPLLHPQADDFFEMEPTVIQRNAPPPKPKQGGGQMSML